MARVLKFSGGVSGVGRPGEWGAVGIDVYINHSPGIRGIARGDGKTNRLGIHAQGVRIEISVNIFYVNLGRQRLMESCRRYSADRSQRSQRAGRMHEIVAAAQVGGEV